MINVTITKAPILKIIINFVIPSYQWLFKSIKILQLLAKFVLLPFFHKPKRLGHINLFQNAMPKKCFHI